MRQLPRVGGAAQVDRWFGPSNKRTRSKGIRAGRARPRNDCPIFDKGASLACYRRTFPVLILRAIAQSNDYLIQLAREDIKREDIPSLKVSVTRSVVSVPESVTEFPVWGPPIQEPSITVGRPGGAAEGE